MSHETLLELRSVSKEFGGLRALREVSLDITDEHRFWGLIGPNGSGKSTLFNLATRVYAPSAGTIIRPTPSARDGVRLASPLGRTFQHPRVFPGLTVSENLLSVSRRYRRREAVRRSAELLELLELEQLAERRAGQLSIGQQKLVELARVLMLRPRLVLLDEVAAGVHPRLTRRIEHYLRTLAEGGTHFLVIEHNMRFLMGLSSYVFVLANGELIAQGPPREVQMNEEVANVYLGRGTHD